jgi:DNA segregation ATPase FtsK/SpoIIIE, S-DNA-T family
MRAHQDRLRGHTRLHEPCVAEPLIVTPIDELAALTGWVADRTVKRRIESALGLLLSQCRARGARALDPTYLRVAACRA